MKIRSSTKIGIGFGLLAAVAVAGYKFYMDQSIRNEHFEPPIPGKVNLVGIDPGAGYQILVANQMAQLVQSSNDFEGKETAGGGATEGAIKKRIPIKEMLGVLQGDQKSAGEFTMRMNDMSEEDFAPMAPVWKSEDLQVALSEAGELRKRLIRDLNIELDGKPLSKLRIASLENGIIVDTPVTLHLKIQGKAAEVVGRVREAYRPRLMRAVEARYADKPDLNQAMQAGYYQEEAQKAVENNEFENVAESIEALIDERVQKGRAQTAERVIRSATVVINESHITNAEFREYDTSDGKRYDLSVRLSDEGRRRLWKYSHDKVGTQLLLITDGIAIAAPRISHELSQGELTITQMRDRVLVSDAVQILNESATKR